MWSLIPFPWKAGAVAVLIVLAGLAIWRIREGIKDEGRREVLTDVNRTNQEASDAARKARSLVRDCFDAGGVWDTSSGKCEGR